MINIVCQYIFKTYFFVILSILIKILQIICIECPTALVWSGVPDGRSTLNGSPLDLLPMPPSSLPMPFMDSPVTEKYRRQVLILFLNIYFHHLCFFHFYLMII